MLGSSFLACKASLFLLHTCFLHWQRHIFYMNLVLVSRSELAPVYI